MKLNIARINDEREIVAGTVKSVNPGTGAAKGKIVNVELEGAVWNKETGEDEMRSISIAFSNTDRADMADRVVKAKVASGSIICVEVYKKDGKYYGNRFMYRGHWVIPASETVREKNIFMGVIASMKTGTSSAGNNYTRVSIPVDKYNDNEPEWNSITFWNNEKSNVADRAAKLLKERDGEKAQAIVVCGEKEEFQGRPQYKGWEFQKIIRNDN